MSTGLTALSSTCAAALCLAVSLCKMGFGRADSIAQCNRMSRSALRLVSARSCASMLQTRPIATMCWPRCSPGSWWRSGGWMYLQNMPTPTLRSALKRWTLHLRQALPLTRTVDPSVFMNCSSMSMCCKLQELLVIVSYERDC